MKGTVLLFNDDTRRGIIEDKNQNRYSFHMGEWLSNQQIVVGDKVCFETPKEEAINITVDKKQKFLNNLLKKGKKLFSFVYRSR